jgi:hypothetical protein
VNGRWIGASAWVENPRVYAIPEGVLKPGRNVVTVRVFKVKPDGGFLDKPDRLRLVLADGAAIPLGGRVPLQLDQCRHGVSAQPVLGDPNIALINISPCSTNWSQCCSSGWMNG